MNSFTLDRSPNLSRGFPAVTTVLLDAPPLVHESQLLRPPERNLHWTLLSLPEYPYPDWKLDLTRIQRMSSLHTIVDLSPRYPYLFDSSPTVLQFNTNHTLAQTSPPWTSFPLVGSLLSLTNHTNYSSKEVHHLHLYDQLLIYTIHSNTLPPSGPEARIQSILYTQATSRREASNFLQLSPT
jgi:hypothetical protein